LIEIIARDVPDLIGQLDGRTVKRMAEKEAVLRLKNFHLENREMTGLEKALGIVSHPNVAYILFLLGLVGLYFEMSSPGAVLPGIVGGIAMLLALYAFSVLPVNFAGVARSLQSSSRPGDQGREPQASSPQEPSRSRRIAAALPGRGEAGYRVDLDRPAAASDPAVLLPTFRTIAVRRAPSDRSVSLIGGARSGAAMPDSRIPAPLIDGRPMYGAPARRRGRASAVAVVAGSSGSTEGLMQQILSLPGCAFAVSSSCSSVFADQHPRGERAVTFCSGASARPAAWPR
jgi:hypothetical protein